MGFSRQEYWSEMLCPPPRNLSKPGWIILCHQGLSCALGHVWQCPWPLPTKCQQHQQSGPLVVSLDAATRRGGPTYPPWKTAALSESAVRSSDCSSLLSSSSAFRLALIQLQVSSIKSENLTRACGLIREASKQGAQIVSLPVSLGWPPRSEHSCPGSVVSAHSGS